MNIVNKSFVSIDEIRSKLNGGAGQIAEKTGSDSGKSFDRVLLDKADQIKFSRHAAKRLETRNISISEEQKARLEDAAEQAMEKGMTESLVMVDDLAFIVNVKNNTVITAVGDATDSIFTNIDGAVIS